MTRAARLGGVALLLAAVSACSSSSSAGKPEPCTAGFLGDAAAAPQFDFQVLTASGSVLALADGGAVPMLPPLQGGMVVYAGVRATNVDGCALQITGSLRDQTNQKVVLEMRTIDLEPTGDGWGASAAPGAFASTANFANIAACPNQWSATDLYGHAYALTVTIVDRGDRTLTRTIQVTPECDPLSQDECLCICKAGYMLGVPCVPDAGEGD